MDNPHPETSEALGKLWVKLPTNYREAIRLHYHQQTEHLFDRAIREGFKEPFFMRDRFVLLSVKHPIIEWLEGFERGVITSSPSSYNALQAIAEKIGFHLKDTVKEMETEKPSPIIQKRKRQEYEEEWIPIDKFLGEYLPDEQVIKLYMKEIRDVAKRLVVDVQILRRVVELHEAAHAIVHLGRDADGRNFNNGSFKMVDKGADPSPLHETFA